MRAMAHLRRYFSLSDVGAIAMRFPATSSRMYTSSVSDPLAKTSNTSSALSRVPSECPSIRVSTAVRASLVIDYPSAKWPRLPRTCKRKISTARPPPRSAGPPPDDVEGPGRNARQRRPAQIRHEGIRRPGAGRDHRDAGGMGGDRGDAGQEAGEIHPGDQERHRRRDVTGTARGAVAPLGQRGPLGQRLGEPLELVLARV